MARMSEAEIERRCQRISQTEPVLPSLQLLKEDEDGQDADGVLLSRSVIDDQDSPIPEEIVGKDTEHTGLFTNREIPEELEVMDPVEDDSEEEGMCERPTERARRPRAGRMKTLHEFRKQTMLTVSFTSSTNSVDIKTMSQDIDSFLTGDGDSDKGAPEQRSDVQRTPEMQKHREMVMEKVAEASKRYAQRVAKLKEAASTRRRSRLKTAPSHVSSTASLTSIASSVVAGAGLAIEPLLIFDWDDTLFPTWYIMEVVKPCVPEEEPFTTDNVFYEPLKAHGEILRHTLSLAREIGNVGIVTLARRPWVVTSADRYLPDLDVENLLMELGIEVFYARECVIKHDVFKAQLEEGVDMYEIAKRNAMRRCLKKAYGRRAKKMHVLSVGDSVIEQMASQEALWCCHKESESFCKTLKLMSDPPLDYLSEELQALQSWMKGMVEHEGDFDISMEDKDGMDQIAKMFGNE
eukprot:TRINITY_DN49751_c0_g1_i1.p1 TRINITY_DN49751_c0_g1~~TRINITY_DN49751_c0_g1_i1.p1  ORF type:complete len:478 (-),score=90.96 TRINITY_DN49751_c0_g1_i1:84-1475(-)